MKSLAVFIVFGLYVSNFNCNSIIRNRTVIYREKRHLDFIEATRVFFRANIKSNIFSWGTIWAHAIGFKANMNINDNKAARPFRRDTCEVFQQLLDFHGFDGKACILKAFCLTTRVTESPLANGMLFKLLRHLFKMDERDLRHFKYLKDENCGQMLFHHCPLSFNSISPFTDEL